MAKKNNLRAIRTSEGLSINELSGLSGVSTKVISEVERGIRNSAPRTKNKMVKGLNSNPKKLKEYTFKDVFPSDNPV